MKKLLSLSALTLLSACATHTSPPLPHGQQGMGGQPLDAVVKSIHENATGEDAIGKTTKPTFDVYMTPLPDENGRLSDEGIVTLSES